MTRPKWATYVGGKSDLANRKFSNTDAWRQLKEPMDVLPPTIYFGPTLSSPFFALPFQTDSKILLLSEDSSTMEEAPSSLARPEFDQTTAGFVEWFTTADGTRLSSKIELKDLRDETAGRGLVAIDTIAEDEELFAVPRPLVLMTTTSSISPTVLAPLADTGTWPPLIVTIIFEYLRRQESPWHPYFQVLPTTFDSLMFWNDEELAVLQASAVVDKIGKAEAEATWKETIIPVMLAHPDLFPVFAATDTERTAELIKLAHMAGSLIMAYAFDIDRDDEPSGPRNGDSDDEFEEDDEDEPLKGMVPFADMLNADADKNNARLFQEDDYLIMKSTKTIAAGDQIFNDYGPLPRSDLLRMYGYVTDNYAKYDVVELSHDTLLEVAGKKHDKTNKAWLKREEQLDELGIIDDGYSIPRPEPDVQNLGDAIPGHLHMLLRALCAHDEDNKAVKKPREPVTLEEAALLQAVLTKRLSEYKTTYEHDRSQLEKVQSESTGPLAPVHCNARRYAMAVQVRMGEKEILRQLISLCQGHIKLMSEALAATKRKRSEVASRNSSAKKFKAA
ncbi:Ribosomal lysine N-methyltransferase 4 [Exophiala xenobiotica]|nr:Ribosomal lysine N-methyltransferase 4 [Exophiala xenobiotica]